MGASRLTVWCHARGESCFCCFLPLLSHSEAFCSYSSNWGWICIGLLLWAPAAGSLSAALPGWVFKPWQDRWYLCVRNSPASGLGRQGSHLMPNTVTSVPLNQPEPSKGTCLFCFSISRWTLRLCWGTQCRLTQPQIDPDSQRRGKCLSGTQTGWAVTCFSDSGFYSFQGLFCSVMVLSESVPLVSHWKTMQSHFQADVENHQVWAQRQGGLSDVPGALLLCGNGDLHRQGDSMGMAGAGSHLGSLLCCPPSCVLLHQLDSGAREEVSESHESLPTSRTDCLPNRSEDFTCQQRGWARLTFLKLTFLY